MQRTISKSAIVEGVGLHSGVTNRVVFKPQDAGKGIVFRRVDLLPVKEISLRDFDHYPQERCTAITKDGAVVHTIEHVMAALRALEIDNIIIEVTAPEMPGMDGSAVEFYNALKEAGIKEYDLEKKEIVITEPIWVEKNDAFIGIFPSAAFKVSYIFESPSPAIGRQTLSLEFGDESAFKEVLNARTFCLKQEAEMLLKMGFGKGANTTNTLVMDIAGPVDNKLRYPDEPVRHKIMDLVGDLYLAGHISKGRVIGIRSGHDLNAMLVKKIKEKERS